MIHLLSLPEFARALAGLGEPVGARPKEAGRPEASSQIPQPASGFRRRQTGSSAASTTRAYPNCVVVNASGGDGHIGQAALDDNEDAATVPRARLSSRSKRSRPAPMQLAKSPGVLRSTTAPCGCEARAKSPLSKVTRSNPQPEGSRAAHGCGFCSRVSQSTIMA